MHSRCSVAWKVSLRTRVADKGLRAWLADKGCVQRLRAAVVPGAADPRGLVLPRANPKHTPDSRPVRAWSKRLKKRHCFNLHSRDRAPRPAITLLPRNRPDFPLQKNALLQKVSLPHGSVDRNHAEQRLVRRLPSRSLTGAWIETCAAGVEGADHKSLPHGSVDRNSGGNVIPFATGGSLPHGSVDRNFRRSGACKSAHQVAPSRERGSKRTTMAVNRSTSLVAPSRERGSKL